MQPPMPQPQPAPSPPKPQSPAEEGFVLINPPLVLYEPSGEHDTLRGYVLSRQEDGNGGAFYCVQLTAPRTQAGRTIEAGSLMAIAELDCIRALSYLMPKLEPTGPQGELAPKSVYEVILEPLRQQGAEWVHLIHTRHLLAAAASPPVLRPPAFAILEPAPPSPAPDDPDCDDS